MEPKNKKQIDFIKKIEAINPKVFESDSIQPIREFLKDYRENNKLSKEELEILNSMRASPSQLLKIYPDKHT